MLRHWICLCACSNVEASIWYIFASLFRLFASLKFSLGYLSGKVHHVHYQLAFFAQRSFKRLPPRMSTSCEREAMQPKWCWWYWLYLNMWVYLMTWYLMVLVCYLWKPFQSYCQASVTSYAACSKSWGRYLFTHTSETGEALRFTRNGATNARDRLHMLHHPCSWLQRMEWHRNCADLRLSCRSLWPQARNDETFHRWQSWHETFHCRSLAFVRSQVPSLIPWAHAGIMGFREISHAELWVDSTSNETH